MKKFLAFVILAGLIAAAWFYYQKNQNQPTAISNNQNQSQNNVISNPMQISSPAFSNNQNIPAKYTCDGEGVNPPLEISGVPAEARTLALIVDDPDAPVGTWVHWTLWNMSASTTVVAENSVPEKAIQGKTSSGLNQYGPPCPPSGTHRYFFKLYALDTKLDLPSYKEAKDLESAMQGHILAQAQIMGFFSKK